MYENLNNPIAIFNDSELNTILSILEYKSDEGYNFQVPIFFNYQEGNLYINAIGTLYHQNQLDNFIVKEVLKHNLIAYNKKIEPYIRSLGLLLSEEEDRFSIYDNSITYSLNNVKKYNLINYYKFITNNKYFKPEFKANINDLKKVFNILNIDINKFFDIYTLEPKISDIFFENIENIQNKLIEYKTEQINSYLNNNKNLEKMKSSIVNNSTKLTP